MNKVYILGAGASVDFYPLGYGWEPWDITLPNKWKPFPTANDFLNKAIKEEVFKEYNKDLLDFIKYKYDITLNDLKTGKVLNIEQVFLDLESEEKLYSSEVSITEKWRKVYQAKYDLLEIIRELLTRLCRHNGPCFNHQKLAKKVIIDEDNVISFNWDTLMDEALLNTEKWFYNNGYGVSFFRMYKDGKEFKENGESKCYLLKPHGSINWFRYMDFYSSHRDGFTGESVSKMEMNNMGLFTFSRKLSKDTIDRHQHPINQRLKLGHHYVPPLKGPCQINILPPGTKRNVFPGIYKKIKDILRNAEEVISIGFSFNKNDYDYFKKEFGEIHFQRDIKISLINPLLGKKLEQLKRIYADFFQTDNVKKFCNTFKEYCDFFLSDRDYFQVSIPETNKRN